MGYQICGIETGRTIDRFFSTKKRSCWTIELSLGEKHGFSGENLVSNCGQFQNRLWNIWGIKNKNDSFGNTHFFARKSDFLEGGVNNGTNAWGESAA